MTALRYGLKFQQLPVYLPIQAQPILVLSKLKQHFPLFNRGNEANEITEFASVTWNDGITDHQVLLFIVKLLYYSYKIRKTRNNSSTESINHSLRLRLTHAHICSIGFKSGLYAGSQRILCPCCSNNS